MMAYFLRDNFGLSVTILLGFLKDGSISDLNLLLLGYFQRDEFS
jgi:hypothetical protein